MKPSQYFLNMIGEFQDYSVQAEIAGDNKLQRVLDFNIPFLFMYAAFFKTVGL